MTVADAPRSVADSPPAATSPAPTSSITEPDARWPRRLRSWHEPRPLDVVGVLTVLLALVLLVPSPLILRPLGAVGTPANLVSLVLLVWWVLAKLGTGLGVARGRQPLRPALFVVLVSLCASLVGLAGRASVPAERTGAMRGLLTFAALAGIALIAADGISTVDRAIVLLRRLVAGVAVVAAIGIVEFATGFNAGQSLAVPGLARNLELPDQGRLLFLRVQSTALHPIELGTLLGLTLPIALQLALTAPPGGRLRSWVPVVLIAAVLPMTLSRTGVIVAAVGLLAVAARWSWRRRIGGLLVLAAFVAAFKVVLPAMIDGLLTIFVTVGEDESTTGRTGRYDVAARYVLEHPWTGRGLSTLHPATGQIFDNQYLYAATETGVVGVLALLVLFATAIGLARTVRRQAPDGRVAALAQALTGAGVAMVVAYATADMASFAMVMTVYFLLIGVTAALWRLTVPAAGTTRHEPT